MKTLIILNALILNLVLSNSIFSQNKSYLDFFGHKYFLKGISETIDKSNSMLPQKESSIYTFCGKNILKVETAYFSSNPVNINAWRDSAGYANYSDSVGKINTTYYVSNIHYKLVDCVKYYNVVDSIHFKDLTQKNNFTVFLNGNEQIINGFKIIGDSLDYEIAYIAKGLNTNKIENKANEYLLKIINENNKCSKFMIKEISFYNKRKIKLLA